MKSHQRGFIPLVAIILLGITAVVGGTIATVSIHKSVSEPVSGSVSDTTKPADNPASATVSTRVESLAKNTKDTPAQQKSEQAEQDKREDRARPTFSSTSVAICDEVSSLQSETSARSLLQDMQVICEAYTKGGYNNERIESAERTLKEKWNLWKKTSAQSRADNFENRGKAETKFSASCNADRPIIGVGDEVTFTAEVSNGVAPYAYEWIGGSFTGLTTKSITTRFSKGTIARANVVVTSADKQTTTATCSVRLNNTTPQSTNTTTEKDTYNESSTYPIITSFSDNHGNLFKGSEYNGYQGSYINKQKVTLRVGDTIRATVEAKDPKGRALEYNWNSNSQAFNKAHGLDKAGYQYSSNNSVEYTLTDEDLKSAGETFRLVYQVRVTGTTYYRFGGGQYDDVGFIDYSLQP